MIKYPWRPVLLLPGTVATIVTLNLMDQAGRAKNVNVLKAVAKNKFHSPKLGRAAAHISGLDPLPDSLS